jgi:hypothetical protein
MTEDFQTSAAKPRTRPNGDSSGSYELVARVIRPLLAPGETLEVEFFFSGYGEILQPKLYFFPSVAVFDPNKSSIRSGLKHSESLLTWGADEMPLKTDGPVLLTLAGVKLDGWPETTSFFDARATTNLISTELKLGGHAPVELKFSTFPSVEPGKYSIEIAFSYYDGQKWRSTSKRVDFAVTSFFERHQRKLAWYGVAASLLGLLLGALRIFMH